MKALSIRQPWAFAILSFGKDVENRDWRAAPVGMVGKSFLIHAAKGCTGDEYLGAANLMRDAYQARPWSGSTILPALAKLPRGAIVGRATLAEVVRHGWTEHAWRDAVCRNCGAEMTASVSHCEKANPWAVMGSLGLVLADVERLAEPVPFKGALGFFEVPDELLAGAKWEPCGGR